MNRKDVLETASKCTNTDRNAIYGEPFHNLSCLTELQAVYDSYAGDKFSPQHNAAMSHVLGKIARIAAGNGKLHPDNYIDGAAYLAIASECEAIATQFDDMPKVRLIRYVDKKPKKRK